MNLVPLHLKSAYSFYHGTQHIKSLVGRAVDLGYKRMALTDRGMYGIPKFIEACEEHKIDPIYGLEVFEEGKTLVLLAKNKPGFSILCKTATLFSRDLKPKMSDIVQTLDDSVCILSDDLQVLELAHNAYALVYPWNTSLYVKAYNKGIPSIASTNAVFLKPEDRHIQKVLLAISKNCALEKISDDELSHPLALLMDEKTISQNFSSLEGLVDQTKELASQIPSFDPRAGFIFPSYAQNRTKFPSTILRERVLAGAELRYGELGSAIIERIDYELDIIDRKGFTAYFLIVEDIVRLASRTCGRGSGAASIVSFCLGITNVDPIEHKLYFERFLNMHRIDPPDIDVDFAWDERDEVIDKVIQRFGESYCARVANHLHFQPRSALRQCAKVLGLPDHEISQIARDHRRTKSDVYKNQTWEDIFTLAGKISTLPHGLSVHCGGLVITPLPIDNFTQTQMAPSGKILAWEKDGTEDMGLIKIDLLGNRSLAVVRDAITHLRMLEIDLDLHTWNPQKDDATISLLAQGQTMGVFYVESPAMRQLQQKSGKGDFDHIVIHSSIIRPAANAYINEYLRRLHGGEYETPDPKLKELLSETYGIMCYQEDISKAAIVLAGFDEGEADQLRKIISKKSPTKLARFREKFYTGYLNKGGSTKICDFVWNMIMSFEGYSFCKPHSASYAMVSFQSAYLKAHYPAIFMAAVLSNSGGFYHAQAYISEARRLGIEILPASVNHALLRYYPQGNSIRVGFMAIPGLSSKTIKTLLDKRIISPFLSFDDFCDRVQPEKDEIFPMLFSGCFDEFLPSGLVYGHRKTLLGSNLKTNNTHEELVSEFKHLGFLLHHHPLELWNFTRPKHFVDSRDFSKLENILVTFLAWPICRKEVETQKNEAMEFFTFEDEYGLIESVLFPKAFENFGHLLLAPQPFIISGKVQRDFGAIIIVVSKVSKV